MAISGQLCQAEVRVLQDGNVFGMSQEQRGDQHDWSSVGSGRVVEVRPVEGGETEGDRIYQIRLLP